MLSAGKVRKPQKVGFICHDVASNAVRLVFVGYWAIFIRDSFIMLVVSLD